MLVPKSDFLHFSDDLVMLATGGQPPLLRVHREMFDRFAADKARGMAGYEAHQAIARAAKQKLSSLTGLPPSSHALIGNASDGISRVVSSFEWRVGDNVVVANKDYASGRFALQRLRAFGVEVRVIEAKGWYIDPHDLLAACDNNTRLMYLSHVTSLTGQRFDIAKIASALPAGTTFLVDASHSMGVIPVDARLADFTVSSGYKFLCATHTGILAWNQEKQPTFEPLGVGWHGAASDPRADDFTLYPDARRAELGNPNYLDVYLLNASLQYLLNVGIRQISNHIRSLADGLYESLSDLGLVLVTPDNADERAANIAFAYHDPATLVREAAGENIMLWGGEGRVRASLHLFNDQVDVDRYVLWLKRHLELP